MEVAIWLLYRIRKAMPALTSRWMADVVAAAVRTSGSVPSLHLALQLAHALAHVDSRMHIFLQHTLQRGRSATVAVPTTAFSLEQVHCCL